VAPNSISRHTITKKLWKARAPSYVIRNPEKQKHCNPGNERFAQDMGRHTLDLLLVPIGAVVDGPEEAAVNRRLVQDQRVLLVVPRVRGDADDRVDARRQFAAESGSRATSADPHISSLPRDSQTLVQNAQAFTSATSSTVGSASLSTWADCVISSYKHGQALQHSHART
jgi:hypothetical protein